MKNSEVGATEMGFGAGSATHIVDQEEVSGAKPEGKPGTESNTSLSDYPRRHSSLFLLPDLDGDESDGQETREHKKHDYPGVLPVVSSSSPLEANQETDNGR